MRTEQPLVPPWDAEPADGGYWQSLDDDPEAAHWSPNLPASFWSARPYLEHIRQAAHSRTRSPDAALGAVLARVAMLTPPSTQLPAITGDLATLDLLVGLIAPSGGGKSTTVSLARRLIPCERNDIVDGIPLGSGEGLVDAFLGPVEETDGGGRRRRVRRQTKTAVLAIVDEGQVLADLGSRRGSTLLPTLRTAWSGGDLGQANATVETHRHLRAGCYRFVAIIGWQPAHAAAVLADDVGGTPQRITWLPATDPNIPDNPPDWPGPLDWTPLPTITGGVEIDVADDVVAAIRTRALARARGVAEGDALAAHDDLGRLKVAALLAILDRRQHVTDDDWQLAGHVAHTSRLVRTSIASAAAADAARRDQFATHRAVQRATAIADTAERRAFVSATRAVGRRAHRDEVDHVTRRELDRAIAGGHRQLVDVDEVITAAIAEGWIEPDGDRFRPGKSRPS